jgi:hypothetical protein
LIRRRARKTLVEHRQHFLAVNHAGIRHLHA